MDLYNVLGGSGFLTKIPKSLMTKVLPFYGTTGKLKVELVEHIDKGDVIEMIKMRYILTWINHLLKLQKNLSTKNLNYTRLMIKCFLVDYRKSFYEYKDHPLMQEPSKIQKMLKEL